jgi:hypothetical protein
LAVAGAPPPTLNGEALNSEVGTGSSLCPSPSFTVSGTIPPFHPGGTSTDTNPYPGSYSETGNWTSTSFNATFTIISGTTTITGSKSGGSGDCTPTITDLNTASATQNGPYTATIHTPSGDFLDQGISLGSVSVTPPISGSLASQSEIFSSTLAQPVPLAPTSVAQCMHGGWQNFPQFKNQGACVSFVATGGKRTRAAASPARRLRVG